MNLRQIRTRRHESGSMLIQVMITSGIVAVLSLAMANIIQNMVLANNTMAAKTGVVSLQQMFVDNLSRPDTCGGIIGVSNDFDIDQASTTDGQPLSFNIPGMGNIAAGSELNDMGVRIDELNLIGAVAAGQDSAGNDLYTGILSLTTSKLKAATGGAAMRPLKVASITVVVDSAGKKIIGCQGENSIAQAKQEICVEFGGAYNSATEKCDLTNSPIVRQTACTTVGGTYNSKTGKCTTVAAATPAPTPKPRDYSGAPGTTVCSGKTLSKTGTWALDPGSGITGIKYYYQGSCSALCFGSCTYTNYTRYYLGNGQWSSCYPTYGTTSMDCG